VSDLEIYQAILNIKQGSEGAVLATVVRDQGSVPRHAGAKMLAYEDGRIIGSIGGGELESRVIAAVPDLLQSGKPSMLHFELSDPQRGDPGVCGGQVDIFMEPILPDPTVLVIGCGHCGQALADLAHWLGYRVIVSDDRTELCNPETVPHADQYLPVPPTELTKAATIHNRTFVAAVTRGVPLDVEVLPLLLETPAPYIGVMGSRRRWATAVKQLKENGIEESALRCIHAPIGLELNAETPRQIAVSIMAEIIAVHRGGSAEAMKWIGTPEEAE
jgi:xanthine dehydrogenase accessory factor